MAGQMAAAQDRLFDAQVGQEQPPHGHQCLAGLGRAGARVGQQDAAPGPYEGEGGGAAGRATARDHDVIVRDGAHWVPWKGSSFSRYPAAIASSSCPVASLTSWTACCTSMDSTVSAGTSPVQAPATPARWGTPASGT